MFRRRRWTVSNFLVTGTSPKHTGENEKKMQEEEDRQTGRQADGQTGRQADRQTGRQADNQTKSFIGSEGGRGERYYRDEAWKKNG